MRSAPRRPPSVVRTAYSKITEDYTFQTKKLQFINLYPNPLNISCIFQTSKKTTNNQGGWCKETSQANSTENATDKTLIPQLSKLLSDKTVPSFGDGPGAYKREIEKLGDVKLYDAFNGAPYCEETNHGRVRFMDLTIPQYGIRQYDWIISLEVAEHIPEKYEAVYLDNILRHATKGIILSWAVPGQGGLSHINNKPIEYVTKVMRDNGFKRDAEKTTKLQK